MWTVTQKKTNVHKRINHTRPERRSLPKKSKTSTNTSETSITPQELNCFGGPHLPSRRRSRRTTKNMFERPVTSRDDVWTQSELRSNFRDFYGSSYLNLGVSDNAETCPRCDLASSELYRIKMSSGTLQIVGGDCTCYDCEGKSSSCVESFTPCTEDARDTCSDSDKKDYSGWRTHLYSFATHHNPLLLNNLRYQSLSLHNYGHVECHFLK